MPARKAKRPANDTAETAVTTKKSRGRPNATEALNVDLEADKIVEDGSKVEEEAANGEAGVVITIERCNSWQVYKKKANELVDFLQKELPDATFNINPVKPRSKAFNITVELNGKKEEVWDGRTMGPPRKLKFPENDKALEAIKTAL